jgi:hypothetical protein
VKEPPLPALPWGTERDKTFLQSDYCEGYGKEVDAPHVIFEKVKGKEPLSVAYAARMMRHFSPMIRTWAAYKLAEINTEEAHEAIAAALTHPDPRVRRAGCDSISSYKNWGRSHTEKVPSAVVSKKFVPHIEAILKDPESAWWEIDGALVALGFGTPEDIRRNMPLIRKFSTDPEWYLRESAYWAMMGLGKEMTGEEFLFLADMYVQSSQVYERSSYDNGINYLLRSAKLQLDEETTAAYVRKLGKSVHSALLASGYDRMAARHESTHRVMMVLKRFKNPPYKLIIPDFLKYLETWTPDFQHSYWLITGNKWQDGLCKIAFEMGEDGRPLVDGLRKCQAKIPAPQNRENKYYTEARDALTKMLAEYEEKFGK